MLPGNLHLALQPGVLAFPELGFSALAAPLAQRHTYNDLTAWFDDASTGPGQLRIGLAHGSVQGILRQLWHLQRVYAFAGIGEDFGTVARLRPDLWFHRFTPPRFDLLGELRTRGVGNLGRLAGLLRPGRRGVVERVLEAGRRQDHHVLRLRRGLRQGGRLRRIG